MRSWWTSGNVGDDIDDLLLLLLHTMYVPRYVFSPGGGATYIDRNLA